MSLRIAQITVNSTDALALARWWADQLGAEITAENEGWFVVVTAPQGPSLAFQRVDDPTPGRNRIHLDLTSAALDAEVGRLTGAGAQLVRRETLPNGFAWVTLADPDGNEFCVSGEH